MPNEKRLSAPTLFALYAVASFAAIVGYQFFFPEAPEPLPIYSFAWRITHGVRRYVSAFPALSMSAVIGSFGFGSRTEDKFGRFSPRFLDAMRVPLLTVIVGSLLYAALFLFILPLADDSRADMAMKGKLFDASVDRADQAVKNGELREAGAYLTICEQIWPSSERTEKARDAVSIGLRGPTSSKTDEPAKMSEPKPSFTGIREGTTVSEAIASARSAYSEARYFDAHWYATFAERLAKAESGERAIAARLAADAWNAISALEPSAEDKETYAVFSRKRQGYQATLAEDWIRAYYIYADLAKTQKKDPDVQKFFKRSEDGAKTVSFFIDEVGSSIGEADLNVFLSLPRKDGGRDVAAVRRLHLFADAAYGEGFELASFAADGRLRFRVEAKYVKLVPFESAEPGTVALMLAIDRETEALRWTPKWTAGTAPDAVATRVMLDAPYELLTLAVRAGRGVETLSIPDLNRGAERLTGYGFVADSFNAEIMRRLVEPFAFLSLAVFVLAAAWRFRARGGPGMLGVPVLLFLPVAADVLVQAYRYMATASSATFAVALPFAAALSAALAYQTVLLLLALVFLAGQRA
jgi:hypothetical protein